MSRTKKPKTEIERLLQKSSTRSNNHSAMKQERGFGKPTQVCRIRQGKVAQKINTEEPIDFPEVPDGGRWLENNPDALAAVVTGLEQAKKEMVTRVSFAEYADIELDD